MPLTLIANGYFRSGTTHIWRILKYNNKNTPVLYEPFHPHLNSLLKSERKKSNILHNTSLWDDYFSLEKQSLNRLTKSTPSKRIFNYNKFETKISEHIKSIHTHPNEIWIQTNRLSLSLRTIGKLLPDAEIIHIIRNPLEVYSSTQNAYSISRNFIYKLSKTLLKPILYKYNFETIFDYKFIYKNPQPLEINKQALPHPAIASQFEMFCTVWITHNFHALKHTARYNSFFTYESLPHLTSLPSSKLDQDCINNAVRILTNPAKPRNQASSKYNYFLSTIEKLDLTSHYKFISNKIRETNPTGWENLLI